MRFVYYRVTRQFNNEEIARFHYLKNACQFVLEYRSLHSLAGGAELNIICEVTQLPRDTVAKLFPSDTFKD